MEDSYDWTLLGLVARVEERAEEGEGSGTNGLRGEDVVAHQGEGEEVRLHASSILHNCSIVPGMYTTLLQYHEVPQDRHLLQCFVQIEGREYIPKQRAPPPQGINNYVSINVIQERRQ